MSNYQRPWWLLVNKTRSLISTVQEESRPGERIFIIRGEPLVQGLAWLTWGPVSALLTVGLLAFLAVSLEVRSQSAVTRALFIGAFLGIPALAWGLTTIGLNQLAKKHLQAERAAEARECRLRLNQETGELSYDASTTRQKRTLTCQQIQQVRLTTPIGMRSGDAQRLSLDTDHGAVTLLDETLGTEAQKTDLAHEIRLWLESCPNK